mmetsp:Transcript_11581/g.38075  ORF Transcript_11581/g.38075 Transcript_11581/m.38075 type:complete len:97 (-) Transcript_11581:529-819(-)
MRVLRKHNVTVRRADADATPVATSRIDPRRRPCFLFDGLHLGKELRCYPSACDLRSKIYCDRCRRGTNDTLRRTYLTRAGEQPHCAPDCAWPGSHR